MNAFFRWEFNSCEMLVKGDDVYPIDYANACPDVAVTSLHYYFPWAITALVSWSDVLPGHRPHGPTSTCGSTPYFAIADIRRWTYDEKLDAYLALADEHFETERYHEWCAEHLRPPRRAGRRVGRRRRTSTGCCVETVQATYPPHEQEKFLAHFRGLIGMWVSDQGASA